MLYSIYGLGSSCEGLSWKRMHGQNVEHHSPKQPSHFEALHTPQFATFDLVVQPNHHCIKKLSSSAHSQTNQPDQQQVEPASVHGFSFEFGPAANDRRQHPAANAFGTALPVKERTPRPQLTTPKDASWAATWKQAASSCRS